MHTAHDSPLGKNVPGSDHYDPGLLYPIERAPKRAELGLGAGLPFRGVDIWNAWELSWLDRRGKPQVALGEFRVPADSPCLIESKSLKLHLASFSQTRFDDIEDVRALIARDLSLASGGDVAVSLRTFAEGLAAGFGHLEGESIDDAGIDIDDYAPPSAGLLRCATGAAPVEETLVSHLFKSNCPVTGQPDWASVQVRYRGPAIDRDSLLRYLVSFRRHDDFHEQCVERIFVDLMQRCAPEALLVHARYTRRGGLDINPWRSSFSDDEASNPRLVRQ